MKIIIIKRAPKPDLKLTLEDASDENVKRILEWVRQIESAHAV